MDDLKNFIAASQSVIYNQDTGSMTWKEKPSTDLDSVRWNKIHAGKECGSLHPRGYLAIAFQRKGGKKFAILAHRLAWFISTGCIPCGVIDHINKNKTDNRIANLRDVSQSINMRNAKMNKTNTSGVVGVTKSKNGKRWVAQAKVNYKGIHIGTFDSFDDAARVATEFRAANQFTNLHGMKEEK